MTSSNINKIVRSSNITLKPWILSKNTSEIVNTCIQKIYKQTPNSFRNNASDLLQSKIATPRPENKAPIRTLRHSQQPPPVNNNNNNNNSATPTAVTRPRNSRLPNVGTTDGDRLLSSVMNNNKRGAVANLVANKKLLKSPNLKIYSSRRFGSSASSSSASIFRRFDERRRNRMQTAQLNYLLRSFGTTPHAGKFKDLGMNSGVAKYLVPSRNQHMEVRSGTGSGLNVPQAVHVSTAIQRDLMLIDNQLKNRIALGRNKLEKLAPQSGRDVDPMDGWHHPPPTDLFLTRLNERNVANAELYEQHRRLKNANKLKQFDHMRRLEARTGIGMSTTSAKKFGRVRLTDALNAMSKQPGQMRVAEQHLALRQPTSRRFSFRQSPMSVIAKTPPNTAAVAPATATETNTAGAIVPVAEPNTTAIGNAFGKPSPSHMATATATSAMANTSAYAANSRYSRSSYYLHPKKF